MIASLENIMITHGIQHASNAFHYAVVVLDNYNPNAAHAKHWMESRSRGVAVYVEMAFIMTNHWKFVSNAIHYAHYALALKITNVVAAYQKNQLNLLRALVNVLNDTISMVLCANNATFLALRVMGHLNFNAQNVMICMFKKECCANYMNALLEHF